MHFICICICSALFNAFDENQDGHIDFREIACGISTCCRGPVAERFACKWNLNILLKGRSERTTKAFIEAMVANSMSPSQFFSVSNRKHLKQSKASYAGYFAGGKNCRL
jgi:hypothetical protein